MSPKVDYCDSMYTYACTHTHTQTEYDLTELSQIKIPTDNRHIVLKYPQATDTFYLVSLGHLTKAGTNL